MTSLAFAWFLVAVLMSRVTLLGKDAPMNRGQALSIALVQGLALCLATPTLGQLGLLTVILVVNLGGAWMEHRNPPRLPLYRLLSLSAILLAAGFVYGPAGGVQLRPPVQSAGAWLVDHVLFFSSPGITSRHLLVLAGALLVINEANLLIRLILQQLDVAPASPAPGRHCLQRSSSCLRRPLDPAPDRSTSANTTPAVSSASSSACSSMSWSCTINTRRSA